MSKKSFSRREFLKSTAGTAGVLAAAPSIFLKPEYIPSRFERVAPSDTVRFGIIGIGMQGSGLLTAPSNCPVSSAWRRAICTMGGTSSPGRLSARKFR